MGYGGLVPFQAVTGYGGWVEESVADLEGVRQHRMGPVLPPTLVASGRRSGTTTERTVTSRTTSFIPRV
jgi:hypothetical protein